MDYTHLYGDIIEKYPPFVNQKQMAKICKITVSTVRTLIKNSEIPFKKRNEKLLHWYEIDLNDALKYLYEKECRQEIKSPYMVKLRNFYKKHLITYPDVLTVKEAMEITGYSDTAIENWVNKDLLCAYKGTKFKIPKVYLIDFLCGVYYRQIRRKTLIHKETMQIFLSEYKLQQ